MYINGMGMRYGMGMQMSYGMGMRMPMNTAAHGAPDFETVVSEMLEQNDADGSGGLSIDEVDFSEEAFAAADADGDGELTQEEMVDYGPELIPSPQGPAFGMMGGPPFGKNSEEITANLMEDLDADESGTLSLSEIDISETAFSQIDTDENDELDEDELTNNADTLRDALQAKRLMEDQDEDGDGVLTAEELDIETELFEELDTDEDGTISRAEAEAGIDQLKPDKPPAEFPGGQMAMMGQGFGMGFTPFGGVMGGMGMYSMSMYSGGSYFNNASGNRFGMFA